MYAALLRSYKSTKDESYLTNAVKKGWLTDEEKEEIISSVSEE